MSTSVIDKIQRLDKLLERALKPLPLLLNKLTLARFKKPLLILAILMILAGAVNNGFTWFILAIPYLIVFLYLIKKFYKKQALKIIAAVSFAAIPLSYDHPHNVLLYPYIGAEIQLANGLGYIKYESSDTRYLKDFNGQLEKEPSRYIAEQALFSHPLKLTLSRVHADHPDMGLMIYPVFTSQTGESFQIEEGDLFRLIDKGRIVSQDLTGVSNIQSRWSYWLSSFLVWPIIPMMVFKEIENLELTG